MVDIKHFAKFQQAFANLSSFYRFSPNFDGFFTIFQPQLAIARLFLHFHLVRRSVVVLVRSISARPFQYLYDAHTKILYYNFHYKKSSTNFAEKTVLIR